MCFHHLHHVLVHITQHIALMADVSKKNWRALFLLALLFVKKELVVASNEVLPNPFVSAETLKACALICLHLLAGPVVVRLSVKVCEGMAVQKARNGSSLVRQVTPLVVLRSMSTTTSAGPLKSLGRIGQAQW